MTYEPEHLTTQQQIDFLMEQSIKHAESTSFILTKLIEQDAEIARLLGIVRNLIETIKFITPGLEEIVENYDGIKGYLSANVSKRLVELENAVEKKSMTKIAPF